MPEGDVTRTTRPERLAARSYTGWEISPWDMA